MTGDVYLKDIKVGSTTDIVFDTDTISIEWLKNKEIILDHTIFGTSNYTINIPFYTESTQFFTNFTGYISNDKPIRKVKPQEVGVDIPGITYLGLNGCAADFLNGITVRFSYDPWGGGILGHAHVGDDPDVGMICTNEEWLKNSDGTYSKLLLHEVAHICASLEKKGKLGHGNEWKKWAMRLGADPSPNSVLPY